MKHSVILLSVVSIAAACAASAARSEQPWIEVSSDRRGFTLADSGRAFVPWGFNYDHDERGRLIEDYWIEEWPKVEADFAG